MIFMYLRKHIKALKILSIKENRDAVLHSALLRLQHFSEAE